VSGEIQETADDIYGSIGDATSPNEAMYSALSDGEIQVLCHIGYSVSAVTPCGLRGCKNRAHSVS